MIPDTLKHEDWNDTDWQYIKGLSSAIENVGANYIRTKGDNNYHLEHVFAYELYYKWKMALRRKGGNPQKLMLNGELTKHYCKTSSYKFPDMVLHKSYNRNGLDAYQCIICEIKSSRNYIPKKDLKKDIVSLCGGITELSYKCGMFIYIGDNAKKEISRLRKIVQEDNIVFPKRIIFVKADGKNTQYEYL